MQKVTTTNRGVEFLGSYEDCRRLYEGHGLRPEKTYDDVEFLELGGWVRKEGWWDPHDRTRGFKWRLFLPADVYLTAAWDHVTGKKSEKQLISSN